MKTIWSITCHEMWRLVREHFNDYIYKDRREIYRAANIL